MAISKWAIGLVVVGAAGFVLQGVAAEKRLERFRTDLASRCQAQDAAQLGLSSEKLQLFCNCYVPRVLSHVGEAGIRRTLAQGAFSAEDQGAVDAATQVCVRPLRGH